MSDWPKRFVYVLQSVNAPSRHYIGLTDNVQRRLQEHNQGHSTHTANYRPWRLHVAMEFSSEAVAIRFEKFLKSGSGRASAKRHFE
jgi:predicted GIY-YIG superfamily endonuclease